MDVLGVGVCGLVVIVYLCVMDHVHACWGLGDVVWLWLHTVHMLMNNMQIEECLQIPLPYSSAQ